MERFDSLYDVRDGAPEDYNFILATFLKGLYYGDSWFSQIPKAIFMENYKVVAQTMVTNPTTMIKVACLKEDPNVILGYSLLSSDFQVIRWVFVKSAWRNRGIARALTPKHPAYVSHLTALGQKLLPKLPNTTFNPFL